jgi:parallel beta-helix repeat protein
MEKEMRKSRTVSFAAILVLLFSAISVILFTVPVTMANNGDCDIYVNTTGWWCDGGAFNPSGTPIQAAVDNASVCCGTFSCASPCTICVKDGNYDENVDVTTANLVIKSENGSASTTVTAANANDDVFHVEAECVTIQGFTVTGANGAQGLGVGNVGTAGIRLGSGAGANYCNILDNHVWGNYVGIILEWSHHNMLSGNTVNDNDRNGIMLKGSNRNEISGNTMNENDRNGIGLNGSNRNEISGNTVNENDRNGIWLRGSNGNEISGNTVNENDRNGIWLRDSTENEISGNTVMNNGVVGIGFVDASNNVITCNLVAYNHARGFYLSGDLDTSTGNTIKDNNIVFNGDYNAGTDGWEWNFHNCQGIDVAAEHNYWGTAVSSEIAAGIWEDTGTVSYEPFLIKLSPCAPKPPMPPGLFAEINAKLATLIDDVSAADMPDIIKQRLLDKLEYAKELKENAKEEYEAGNFAAATKKLGVAKSQVESFESMVKITRRISPADKASFLADSTKIIGKIDTLIEYIQNDG